MITPQEMHEALLWRYATKKFDPGKTVSPDDLRMIMETIRLAPTSFGLQPFHVYIISEQKEKEALFSSKGLEQKTKADASHVLVFCADTDIKSHVKLYVDHLSSSGKLSEAAFRMIKGMKMFVAWKTFFYLFPRAWAARQAYIALGFALVSAAQLRIDSCAVEGFFVSHVSKVLKLPKNHQPVALLALGYRASDDVLYPKYRLPEGTLFTKK
ncbi:NAD(P)H-dependent oxidoreductase [bacterium]|nr:MAG: NAD(P)H-dependent oxidoreductase [bacterium]